MYLAAPFSIVRPVKCRAEKMCPPTLPTLLLIPPGYQDMNYICMILPALDDYQGRIHYDTA